MKRSVVSVREKGESVSVIEKKRVCNTTKEIAISINIEN